VTEAMFLVLIIEDDAGIRGMLRVLLESQHYRVVEAETAARGIIERATIGRSSSSSISACLTGTGCP